MQKSNSGPTLKRESKLASTTERCQPRLWEFKTLLRLTETATWNTSRFKFAQEWAARISVSFALLCGRAGMDRKRPQVP